MRCTSASLRSKRTVIISSRSYTCITFRNSFSMRSARASSSELAPLSHEPFNSRAQTQPTFRRMERASIHLDGHTMAAAARIRSDAGADADQCVCRVTGEFWRGAWEIWCADVVHAAGCGGIWVAAAAAASAEDWRKWRRFSMVLVWSFKFQVSSFRFKIQSGGGLIF